VTVVSAVLLVLACAVARAGEDPGFRYLRPVVPAGPGPNRLVVDVPLLTGARPMRFDAAGGFAGGMEDVRLFASDGREVPYLLVAPPPQAEQWHEVRIVPIMPTRAESGFEFDVGGVEPIDRLRMTGLRSPFLKRLRLEGSGDRVHWIVLADAATVFDLPDERMRRTEVGFAREAVRYVRVTWDDRNSAPLAPPATVAVRLRSAAEPAGGTAVPVAFARRPSEPRTSRFRIRLPGAGLPVRSLELEVGGERLSRQATVTEPRLVGGELVPRELGTALLRRVVLGGAAATEVQIAMAPPSEPELELVVDDGDNPPLDLRGVWAEVPAFPWLYFESSDGAALTARFGAPMLDAPRYDLEAARDVVRTMTAPHATWGIRTEAPAPPSDQTSQDVNVIGALVDPDAFGYERAIESGPIGLTALRLDAAVLAHSRALADVRIVDTHGRQIAYVVEHLGEPAVVALPPPIAARTRPDGMAAGDSGYDLVLPHAGLPQARLLLSTTARVFERRVTVWVDRRGGTDARSRGRWEPIRKAAWRHVDPQRPAPPLAIELPPLEVITLVVGVDDGANGPLPLGNPQLLLPARRLRFVRPADGPLRLLYGAPSLAAPRYDLALLAPRLLGTAAHEVAAGPEPGPTDHERATEARAFDERVLWAVLLAAIVALGLVLARVLRTPAPS
jgi:hypothetical protein